MATTAGTIGGLLQGAVVLLHGETSSPQLDAELLLAHVLKQSREFVIAHRDDAFPPKHERAFNSLVRRRAEGIPLPYLTREREFYGRRFAVTPAVMVPRPESEAMVEEALRLLDTVSELHPLLADIGTGSGVLGVSLAVEAPRVRVVATDSSEAALAVARRNARTHKVASRMRFLKSDLLTEIPPDLAPTLIVANLPYLLEDEMKRAGDSPETRGLTFEPPKALDGGPDGLFVIRRFFAQLTRMPAIRDRLQVLILEHAPTQRRTILELAHDALPDFRPHNVTPLVTRWERSR